MPFLLDDLLIGAGVSAGTGLISKLFSGDSDKSEALKKLRDKINSIQQLSRAQISSDLSSIDSSAKSAVTTSLNQAALSTAGRQNAKASLLSSIAPALAQMRSARELQLKDYNRNLQLQKAQMEAGIDSQLDNDTPQMDIMNILSLGLQGAMMSASDRGNMPDKPSEDPFGPRLMPEKEDIDLTGARLQNFNFNGNGYLPSPIKSLTGQELYTLPNQSLPPIEVMKKLKKYKRGIL